MSKDFSPRVNETEEIRWSNDKNFTEKSNLLQKYDNEENHQHHGEFIKSMIYGGLDGIITTYALVSAVAGSGLPSYVILVLGISNLIADSISMGLGDYMSERTEIEYVKAERDREEWEVTSYLNGEIEEMVEIYVKKGVSREDAIDILTVMSKYTGFFIDHMMMQELNLFVPTGDEKPALQGAVTMLSFCGFGFIPLSTYIFLYSLPNTNTFRIIKFLMCTLLTLIALFFLGAFSGNLSSRSVWKSALFVTGNGAIAALAAFATGYGLALSFGINANGIVGASNSGGTTN